MDPILISFGIFLISVLFIGALYFFIWEVPERDKRRQIKTRLESISQVQKRATTPELDLIKKELLSDVPAFNKILMQFSHTSRLKKAISQADMKMSVGTFVLLSLVIFAIGVVVSNLFLRIIPVSLVIGGFFGCIPFDGGDVQTKQEISEI